MKTKRLQISVQKLLQKFCEEAVDNKNAFWKENQWQQAEKKSINSIHTESTQNETKKVAEE